MCHPLLRGVSSAVVPARVARRAAPENAQFHCWSDDSGATVRGMAVAPRSAPVLPDSKPHVPIAGVAFFALHTALVYVCAIRIAPWTVYHFFGWIAPLLKMPVTTYPPDWYLQHMEVVTVVPAVILGYLSLTRFVPTALLLHIGEREPDHRGVWAWVIPAGVLAYKMVLYQVHAPSVLYGKAVSTVEYFFDIQKVMPTFDNWRATDPPRVVAQMIVTAPFYAGIAYALGALALKHKLLSRLFTFEKAEDSTHADS